MLTQLSVFDNYRSEKLPIVGKIFRRSSELYCNFLLDMVK